MVACWWPVAAIDSDPLAGPLDTAELFDPATGTFSPTGRMVVGSEAHVATLLADGRVLVIGGIRVEQ